MKDDVQVVQAYLHDHGSSDSQVIAMTTGLSLDRVLLAKLTLAQADRGGE
jgi:hypothetical protein